MATTVNNTTANTRISILFDSDINPTSTNDGPVSGTGNTESDIYIDNKVYLNVRSHTEVPSEIHALQWNAATNTGVLEYTDNRENLSISELPSWASNCVIRCEAEDVWKTQYDSNVASQLTTWKSGSTDESPQTDDNFVANVSMATTHADSERNSYLSSHSITY